jgi:hypothetical protein
VFAFFKTKISLYYFFSCAKKLQKNAPSNQNKKYYQKKYLFSIFLLYENSNFKKLNHRRYLMRTNHFIISPENNSAKNEKSGSSEI